MSLLQRLRDLRLTLPHRTATPEPLRNADLRSALERLLSENIIPFWHPQTIDTEHGGYRLNHDVEGRWKGPANKRIVTQARTLWFFARMVRSPYGGPLYHDAAEHGYRFLRDHMWDHRDGGFFWEVDTTGTAATRPEKHLYGQAFGLYALVEYAQSSDDAEAERLGRTLFDLCETRAHDVADGGYREGFARDWTLLTDDDLIRPVAPKRMNTHLHLLEALVPYYGVTRDPRARERLAELILVLSNAVVRKTTGACTDVHQADWTPIGDATQQRVSFGHDLENIWLLGTATDALGMPNHLLLDLYRTMFDYALRYGFDAAAGGFYSSGPLGLAADRREKIWWVQAEALVSALTMWRWTGDERYWTCFARTLEWVVQHQADWRYGDWHAEVLPGGSIRGDKAGAWKCPYHGGRAVIRCLELLPSEMT